MKLLQKEYEGIKCATKLPEWLDGVFPKHSSGYVLELGNLGNYKRFMQRNKGVHLSHHESSEKLSEDMWSGSKTYDDFLDILENGDEDVISKIKIATGKEVEEISKKYKEEIINYKFDVVGEFFDIGLVVTGVPESWLEPESIKVEKVRVELLLNGAFHSGFDKDDIVKAASRLLAITKILENHNVQVKIKLVSFNQYIDYNNLNLTLAVNVKEYDEPINYKKVSAMLSPTFHRRGTFKVMEMFAENDLASNYGRPLRDIKGFIDLNNKKAIDDLEKRLFKGGAKK